VFSVDVLTRSTDTHIVAIGKSEIWAVALSQDGQQLAGTTHDGHIKVWNLSVNCDQIWDFETKGSFGLCIDWVILHAINVIPQCADSSSASLLMADT
jgi:WD40 repeat protein